MRKDDRKKSAQVYPIKNFPVTFYEIFVFVEFEMIKFQNCNEYFGVYFFDRICGKVLIEITLLFLKGLSRFPTFI